MKKLILNTLLVALTLIVFTSCKSTKKGCGLTSDVQKVEHTTTTAKTTVLAEV